MEIKSDINLKADDKGSVSLSDIKSSPKWTSRVDYSSEPKKKYALCIGYTGTNYYGLQINPNVLTIECVVERALFLGGYIDEANFANLQKLSWTRAARTDKGVHALTQCCSMKLHIPSNGIPSFITQVNLLLPDDIRILCVTKVAKSFNAKISCTGRRYDYLLPTYVLASKNLESVGGIAASFTDMKSKSKSSMPSDDHINDVLSDFRISNEVLDMFRAALTSYVGTNNFHNFTSNKAFDDASAQRYINSFICSEPFTVSVPSSAGSDVCFSTDQDAIQQAAPKGVEWVRISVHGQSFLLNQIRKMIGLAVDIARGVARHKDVFPFVFSNANVDIPMVPGLGLYLDELFFERYNAHVDFDNKNMLKRAKVSHASSTGKRKFEEGADVTNEDKSMSTSVPMSGSGIIDADGSVVQLNEKLLWSLPSSASFEPIRHFKENVLWQHIVLEDLNSRSFLQYIGYLKAFPRSYTDKAVGKVVIAPAK